MTTNVAGHPARQQESASDIVRQLLIVVATIAMLTVNYLANALPINGLDTGQISDQFNVLFVPAGYVFSIWGLIYLGIVGYTVYQALPGQRANPLLRVVGPLYLLSAAANIAWIFLWHYEQFVLTLPVMLILLGSLVAIYIRINGLRINGRNHVSTAERWLVQTPFSIYLGWITVATIANTTTLLDYLNWGGWGIGEQAWFLIMLAIATGIGLVFAWLRRDVAYVAVLVWAFAGIAVKHSAVAMVTGASIGAAVILAVAALIGWWRGRQ